MPKTTTHYVAALARQARKLGLDIDQILTDVGIPAELSKTDDQWIDNRYVTKLLKRMWKETGCESWRLDADPMRLGSWALACEFMLGAQTLGELLRKGEHILSYLPSSAARMSTEIDGDNVNIVLHTHVGDNDPDHILVEFMSVVWHRFPCWAIDENIALHNAFFSYAKPAHSNIYHELFHCPIHFQQQQNSICFHKRYLSRPIVRNKTELDQWLRDSPADLMYLPGREKSVRAHIKIHLLENLNESMRFPAFESVCSLLFMSPQVVRRRLSEEGTSYQKIKDSVRWDLSMELLANPDLLLAEIAERTGFAEAAAFSRAFKKWTGVCPAQYREHNFGEPLIAT